MSQIRKAHSVEVIDRRLRDAESVRGADAMELVGLYYELARVERKWIAKASGELGGREPVERRRPLADSDALNARFERLTRLIDSRLRKPVENEAERALLSTAADRLHRRVPLTAPVDR